MRNIIMDDLSNIKSAWTSPTQLTVTAYHPCNLSELRKVINYLLHIEKQTFMTEISFDRWEDKYISRVGAIMITPAVFITLADYIFLCEHFSSDDNRQEHINICGKDKLYIDSNFDKKPFEKFLGMIEDVKTLKASNLSEVNKIFTRMLDMKPFNTSFKYTFQDFQSQYLVHNSDNNIKNCMFVMLSKVFSYYNGLMESMEFIKSGDKNLTYYLSNHTFVCRYFEKQHYDNTTFGMYITLLSSFVEYYQNIISSLVEHNQFRVIDHYSRYIVFRNEFIEKYANQCCYVVEYNDKRFIVLETKDQILHIKHQIDIPEQFLARTNVLFEKHLDKIYKLSLLRSGCGGYDEILIKDVPLK